MGLSSLLLLQLHIFERTRMQHKGAAVLVGVNGLLALEAIDRDLLNGLLQKAIKLEGSGVSCQWGRASHTGHCMTTTSSSDRRGRPRSVQAPCEVQLLTACMLVCPPGPADRYNMHTGEWMEFTAMSNDKFKELYG